MQTNIVAGLASLLVSSAFLLAGLNLTGNIVGVASGVEGPAVYPRILAILWILLSLSLIILRPTEDDRGTLGLPKWRPLLILAVGAAYVALLPYLGFIPSSVLAVPAIMFLAGERRPLFVIVGTLVLTLLVYALFRLVLVVLLPTGSLLG